MDKRSVARMLRAVVSSLWEQIWTGFTGASSTEQVATLLGVLGVWLMIRQSLWAFPVGLVQVVLSAIVFFRARFYADMKLQGVFFAALAYGWWHWTRGALPEVQATKPESAPAVLPVTRLSRRGWVLAVGAGIAGTLGWGWYLAAHTDAAMPFRDAFIASFSVVAQWLQARKKMENWFGWMLVNATAVPVYWLGGMPWFALLYFIFLLMAIGGWWEWRRSWPLTRGPASVAAPDREVGKENTDAG